MAGSCRMQSIPGVDPLRSVGTGSFREDQLSLGFEAQWKENCDKRRVCKEV